MTQEDRETKEMYSKQVFQDGQMDKEKNGFFPGKCVGEFKITRMGLAKGMAGSKVEKVLIGYICEGS